MSVDGTDFHARPAARRWRCQPPNAQVLAFHQQLPGYAPTPLVELPALATQLGVARVLVKDESSRLGLPAFKILGASWAVACLVAAGSDLAPPWTLPRLQAAVTANPIRLVTATDGNHGRAVARMAGLLGADAHILLPGVVHPRVAELIAAEGAEVTVLDAPYDEVVVAAARTAAGDARAQLVQDTAWEGYETVPAWIVEGYSTLTVEVDAQLAQTGVAAPDLIVVGVGVGSLAHAVVAHHRSRDDGRQPAVLSAEPDSAACVLASLRAGVPRSVPTAATVMAGLNCGTVSRISWPILRDGLDAAVALSDAEAHRAVVDLARLGVSSGPSGAATLAAARAVLTGPDRDRRRTALGIDEESVVVLLSTEGGSPTAS